MPAPQASPQRERSVSIITAIVLGVAALLLAMADVFAPGRALTDEQKARNVRREQHRERFDARINAAFA